MATLSSSELVAWLEQQQFLTPAQIESARALANNFADTHSLAKQMMQSDWLTPFQVNQILQGKQDDLILGDYRLRERIGDGAMGHVYKAWSLRLHRVVALKTIHKDRIDSPNAKKRFDREMKAAQISHPNIALVRDADEDNDRPFLVMDFIDGINLSARVKQQGAVPIAEAAEYARQAALGLQYAFECGIVHRDIKPANLMVVSGKGDAKPVVKILDFGLARYKSEEDGTRLTQLNSVLGTVDYVAPEQAQNASSADIRADIYSLGCTLFYLLTARPPFSGETVIEKIAPRLTGEAPWVRIFNPEVSPGLEEIVRKMMARLPEDRYQTPAEVAQALAPYTGATPASTPSMSRVVLAVPIMAEPSASCEFTGMSASGRATVADAKPKSSRPNVPLPTKWLAVAGASLLLMSLACMGSCGVFWFVAKPARNAAIVVERAKLLRPSQTVKPGDRSHVIVYIERVNFVGPVTVSLVGLPAGVLSQPKVIAPNERSADVPFTVSHGTDPSTTHIRIVAECEAASATGELSMPFTIEAEKKAKK